MLSALLALRLNLFWPILAKNTARIGRLIDLKWAPEIVKIARGRDSFGWFRVTLSRSTSTPVEHFSELSIFWVYGWLLIRRLSQKVARSKTTGVLVERKVPNY